MLDSCNEVVLMAFGRIDLKSFVDVDIFKSLDDIFQPSGSPLILSTTPPPPRAAPPMEDAG